jgi:S-phase kinase-associated protein 1
MPEIVAEPYDGVDWAKFIVLQSNDQPTPVEYKLSRELAMASSLIKDMLEDATEGEQTVIPIPNASGKTLAHVISYMEHHENNKAEPIEKPLKVKIDDVISEWDKAFLFTELIKDHDEKQHEVLINVIMAANFLNIKDLLDLTCAAVAGMVNGKTTEQIRTLFNIVNDFSPEEEARLKEEAKWCEE